MGRPGRISSAFDQGRTAGLRPRPKNLGDLKTIVVMILMVGVAVLATSHCLLLCMHYACIPQNKAEPSEQRREGDNDQTDRPRRTKENPKPEREAEGVGCKSGT